ncbi:MAG: MYXO-CTERM domain-containing protein [Polyangiales bacterium]
MPSRVSGGFRLDVDASLLASYQTTDVFIDALPPIQSVGETRRIAPTSVEGFGDSRDLTVHPEGLLNYLLNLRLHPVIFIEAAGRRFDLPIDPITLELLDRQSNVVFSDANVHVPLPNISVMPDSFNFGTLLLGERVLMPLEIENTGESPLTVDFVVPANIEGIESLTLAPRTRTSVEVGYRPGRLGELGSSLELRTNDPDAARIRISLEGQAVASADAGPAMDAGVGDSGPSFDAAGDVGPQEFDGGLSGGCGCRTSPTGTAPPALLLFALALLFRRRRQSQRATTQTL